MLKERIQRDVMISSNRNVKRVLDMYCVWSWQRNRIIPATTIGVDLENVSTVTVDGLLYSLPRFTCKTYDSGGSEYTTKTLKDILLIQMYLRSLGIVQKFLSFLIY